MIQPVVYTDFPCYSLSFSFSLRDLDVDVGDFLRSHGSEMSSGRDLARILHSQKAPSHAAISRNTAQRERRANHSVGDEDDRGIFGISPFAHHPIWGRYKSIDFPTVLARCEQLLQRWQSRRQSVENPSTSSRPTKRAKLNDESVSTAVQSKSLQSSSSSSILNRLPSSSSLHLTAKLPSVDVLKLPSTSEIIIPPSDEEEDADAESDCY